ncbi:uncharacterized protein At3g52155, chloroplastic [Beta vulgaris subsp. vulgaris]|uniref:uncharacterized protein At3g52155, chloroplastic n=1 Tax=Beta vulgaris subsp. vulgaris TaxID=3555 RepID=UPI002036C2A9|nr:uncharacterized protein At3g52155, chloroplastic [Beta vulgaris subsp. vulgaris]
MDAACSCMPLRHSFCPIALISRFPGPLIRKKTKRLPYRSLILDNAEGSALEKSSSESVTRRLILLRHAESTWSNHSLRDHERPLSKAGRADAADVSYKLQRLGWVPELILCSDAARTRETLSVMQERCMGFLQAAVHFFPSFYSVAAMDGQTAEHLQQMICKFSSDDILTVMCMGHNKGWEEAASMFTGSVIELKTCNAALLEATGKSWEEAFESAGLGGWKLQGLVKPNSSLENYVPT